MMKKTYPKQFGFSLIELMISMSVGVVLTSGAISMFTNSLKNSYEFTSLTKLDRELQGVMDLISKEVRRSGYDGNAISGNDTAFGINANSTTACLLYSYDSDTTGTSGTLDSNENFGIRFSSPTVYFGSSVTSCAGSGWNSINDINTVQISALSFTQNNLCLNLKDNSDCNVTAAVTGDKLLWRNQLSISISGNYTNDPNTYTRTIQNTVRLHNDILKTEP